MFDTANQPSPYSLLGVSPTDDFSEIRAAWRRLVKTFHPDVWHGSEEEATRRLVALNDAYDRLSVLHNRARAEFVARGKEARARKAAGTTRRAHKPKPQTETPKAQASEQRRTAPESPVMRAQRPNPVAGRFDAARAVFSDQDDGEMLAFV